MAKKLFAPPWNFDFRMEDKLVCLLCHESGRPMLIRPDPLKGPGGIEFRLDAGICEACAVQAYWLWRERPGEVPPGFSEEAATQVATVKVLLPLCKPTEDGKQDAGLASSYDFVGLLRPEDGALDLPTEEIGGKDDSEEKAVSRALARLGVATWPVFTEILYRGYMPRGRLASVVLVTAWMRTSTSGEPEDFKRLGWPLQESCPPGLRGFYLAMREVLDLRLFKYQIDPNRRSEISTEMRKAAVEFMRLQAAIRAKRPNLDTSMLEYLRQSMSEDESAVYRKLRAHETASAELEAQRAAKAEEEGLSPPVRPNEEKRHVERGIERGASGSEGSSRAAHGALGGGAASVVDDEDGGDDPDDAEDDSDDPTTWGGGIDLPLGRDEGGASPPPGFARRGRPLSTTAPGRLSQGGESDDE
jgi:hypothetical protein